MTEPGAGSDLRSMKTSAVESGGDFLINGTKHFISHADRSDFVILFAASGEESGSRGPRKKITAFLIDMGQPGFKVLPGYKNVSHRGYTNSILEFNDCRVPKSAILGEVHRGFEVANDWLGATRLQVAATCLGRAERALDLAKQWAVDRIQFGQQIGKFQGVSFKLADMAVELRAAELLVLEGAWKHEQKTATDMDMAMAKLKATEMLAMVADEALQIHGGMGVMSDLPLGAHLARCANRAHLGRYQRGAAPHHLAGAAPAARRVTRVAPFAVRRGAATPLSRLYMSNVAHSLRSTRLLAPRFVLLERAYRGINATYWRDARYVRDCRHSPTAFGPKILENSDAVPISALPR